MKSIWLLIAIATLMLSTAMAAEAPVVNGTWSGTWTPKEGVADGVTVELKVDTTGNLSGKFLAPVRMDLTKATFTEKTRTVAIEAVDEKTNKHYKLDGKVNGSEITGMFEAGEVRGDVRLVKWTYVP